jgi:gliding motility associated protien GldN
MKIVKILLALVLCTIGFQAVVTAQIPEPIRTESDDPEMKTPLDGVVERKQTSEKRVLPYTPVREADYVWERRVWRLIDIREKMNLPFQNPNGRFIEILIEAAKAGEITVYQEEDFSGPLTLEELLVIEKGEPDTSYIFDPETYEEVITITQNDLNPDDIKQFRVKEVWFFDKQTSTMRVRILGIAPIRELYDEYNNLMGTIPMFWVYYPDARYMLARHRAFRDGNDASQTTWEDLLEMRFFSSHIYKARNVLDYALKDIYTGVDLLMEGQKIRDEIFNWEIDLWSY